MVDFTKKLKKQGNNTSDAALIFSKYVNGEKLSQEELERFRVHVLDFFKIMGIGIPFVLIPGSTFLLPLIAKIAKKNGINILPSSFDNEKNDEKVEENYKRFKYIIDNDL